MRLIPVLGATALYLLAWSACAAFGDSTGQDKEAAFWRWFASQSERFYNLESDRDNLFRELNSQLHRVNR